MQKKPLVSIIMNCLNGSKYLNEAIKSVLDQTYRNWEIIFFDNNSTDQSHLILQKYSEKRIKYFKSKITHTLYKARNLAIKKSKGDLIAFLDVDDWWTKDKLKKQVNFFLNNRQVASIKEAKIKVQASIQGDELRVNGAKRDILQECITLVKSSHKDFPLHFGNFRD